MRNLSNVPISTSRSPWSLSVASVEGETCWAPIPLHLQMDNIQHVLVPSHECWLASCPVKSRPCHRHMLRWDGNVLECPPQVIGKRMVELDRECLRGSMNPLYRLYDHWALQEKEMCSDTVDKQKWSNLVLSSRCEVAWKCLSLSNSVSPQPA